MVWTHIYDFILKLIALFLVIILLVQIPWLTEAGLVLPLLAIPIYVATYNYFFRTAATYLYCRFTLDMQITYAEAKLLRDAFTPAFSFNIKWLPMTDLEHNNSPDKFQIALERLNQSEAEKKLQKEERVKEFKASKLRTKVLSVMMILAIVWCAIAGLLNIFPADYVSEAYMKAFDTDSYYPLLNCIILMIPTAIFFKLIDRNIRL